MIAAKRKWRLPVAVYILVMGHFVTSLRAFLSLRPLAKQSFKKPRDCFGSAVLSPEKRDKKRLAMTTILTLHEYSKPFQSGSQLERHPIMQNGDIFAVRVRLQFFTFLVLVCFLDFAAGLFKGN